MDRFKRRYVLVPNVFSTQGPKGDKGDPGISGESALPISTDDVDYRGNPLTPIIDELLYVFLNILFFSVPTRIFELGQVLTSIQFSWNYNKSIQTQTITGTNVVSPTLNIGDRTKVVTLSSISSNTDITLTADDDTGDVHPAKQAIVSIVFYNKIYYGKHVVGTINNAFVLALPTKTLQGNKKIVFNTDPGINEYIWFASPISYGVPAFKANGFDGGFDLVSTFSFTNASGHTESYYVYRSTNSNLGLTNIEVD